MILFVGECCTTSEEFGGEDGLVGVYSIGRKEVFYSMTQLPHYLQLCGIRFMVKDHPDSQRRNPLLPLHGLLFFNISKGSFICTIPQSE